MSRVVAAAAVCAALLFPCASAAQEPSGSPLGNVRVGPYRLGMTSAEARAATPPITWRYVNDYGPETFAMAANSLFVAGDSTLGGRIEGGRGFYGIDLSGAWPAPTAGACETRVLALIAALEPGVGPLTDVPQLDSERASEEILTIGGSRIRAGVLEKGRLASRKGAMDRRPDTAYFRGFATVGSGPQAVRVKALGDFRAARTASECTFRFTADYGRAPSPDRPPVRRSLPRPGDKARPPKLIDGDYGDYPVSARAAGHQGSVSLSAMVQTDGSLSDVTIETSSRSDELDRAAMEAFSAWRYSPALDADGRPVSAQAYATLPYLKDSIGDPSRDLSKKSCAEFVVDVRWHAGAFPEQPRSAMNVYTLIKGAFSLLAIQKGSITAVTSLVEGFPYAFDETYAECLARPEARMVDIIRPKVAALLD